MSKFSSKAAPTNVRAPLGTTGVPARTYEGGVGYERDPKSELFLLAVANMVGEDTFYESGANRDERFRNLVHACTVDDPDWVAAFVPYLRNTMQMRSASVVMAAEYVKAGGPNGRRVVASALARADEPAEVLAYWAQEYGRRFPQPLKRGVADSVQRLYNERAALRYDGNSRAWRMGDVVDLVHPNPSSDWQSALYRWLLDVRHKREDVNTTLLPTLRERYELEAIPVEARRGALDPERLARAGMSWEALAGWLQGPMDAQAWEAVIPSMGYMALLRNLRNFEQAGVSDTALASVAATLADRDNVRSSRQFPLRFLSAYKNIASERFAWPLQQAVEHSVENIARFPGRSLVLVDVSGSMHSPMSDRSQLLRGEAASLFGVAFAKRCEHADLVAYSTNGWRIDLNGSVLRLAAEVGKLGGGGTNTMQILAAAYGGHDRVLILTDEQAHYGPAVVLPCPVYTFNLAGYRVAHMPQGEKGSYVFGGLTDAAFTLIKLLDERRDGAWPFLAGAAA